MTSLPGGRRYAVTLTQGQLELLKTALNELEMALRPERAANRQRCAETLTALLAATPLAAADEAQRLLTEVQAGVRRDDDGRFVESGPPRVFVTGAGVHAVAGEKVVRLCPHCAQPAEVGWITCGWSACQEAEYLANRERAR